MAKRKEPIYETPREVYLPPDEIIPYGGRVRSSSESWLKEATSRLLGGSSEEDNSKEEDNM